MAANGLFVPPCKAWNNCAAAASGSGVPPGSEPSGEEAPWKALIIPARAAIGSGWGAGLVPWAPTQTGQAPSKTARKDIFIGEQS